VKIAIVNESTLFAKADCDAAVAAVKTQLHDDVAPAWNRFAPDVQAFDKLADVPAGWCILAILDNADQAGALGYHAETPTGQPYGRVFVKVSQRDGTSVSSVLSHEAAEMFADRACNRWAQAPDGTLWAIELGDPVQGDSYQKGGVEVSNFVTQAFFDDTPAPGAKFDHLGKLSAPFTLSPGGYAITMTGGEVSQIQADGSRIGFAELAEHKQHPAARSARRFG
jgi:hypothetical protein